MHIKKGSDTRDKTPQKKEKINNNNMYVFINIIIIFFFQVGISLDLHFVQKCYGDNRVLSLVPL